MKTHSLIYLGVLFLSAQTMAATIGQDCSPSGLINLTKEVVSPVTFWTAALREIEQELDGAQVAYRIKQLENRNDHISDNLVASEMRALGIVPQNDPQFNRVMAESDRLIDKLDRDMLLETQRWAAKCRTYANKKLGK